MRELQSICIGHLRVCGRAPQEQQSWHDCVSLTGGSSSSEPQAAVMREVRPLGLPHGPVKPPAEAHRVKSALKGGDSLAAMEAFTALAAKQARQSCMAR